MTNLWTPTTLGNINLPHRLALAPMTRSRANADGTPTSLVPIYYAQRASLGLLITEGTQPSEDGQGYMLTPGIHSDAQVAAWKKVATAVHAEGGHDIVSDGTCAGSIQVPSSGRPIVLMAERQTTGGYPKIATVISADLPIIGRRRPGRPVRFAAVSVREAETARREQEAALAAQVSRLRNVTCENCA